LAEKYPMKPINQSYNQQKGLEGENLALKFLRKNRYTILEQRYRTRFGEIDIIGLKKRVLTFFEVKWRKTDQFGDPLEAVRKRKIEHLKKAAYCFLNRNRQYQKDFYYEFVAVAVRPFCKEEPVEIVKIHP
jgi:putative endonuclease